MAVAAASATEQESEAVEQVYNACHRIDLSALEQHREEIYVLFEHAQRQPDRFTPAALRQLKALVKALCGESNED